MIGVATCGIIWWTWKKEGKLNLWTIPLIIWGGILFCLICIPHFQTLRTFPYILIGITISWLLSIIGLLMVPKQTFQHQT